MYYCGKWLECYFQKDDSRKMKISSRAMDEPRMNSRARLCLEIIAPIFDWYLEAIRRICHSSYLLVAGIPSLRCRGGCVLHIVQALEKDWLWRAEAAVERNTCFNIAFEFILCCGTNPIIHSHSLSRGLACGLWFFEFAYLLPRDFLLHRGRLSL